jgi:hypothetical protein
VAEALRDGKARDQERSAVWVRDRFGGPLSRALLKELPLLSFAALLGLLTLGWQAALINVVLLLVVVFSFRAWRGDAMA